ncbi:TPA: GNAT family N-acetyltransferase, partial [Listeria innocua]
NLHRVYLQVFSFNERAIKLYEKMGFTHDGKFREAIYRDGRWHDTVIMSILKKEYLNKEQSDL